MGGEIAGEVFMLIIFFSFCPLLFPSLPLSPASPAFSLHRNILWDQSICLLVTHLSPCANGREGYINPQIHPYILPLGRNSQFFQSAEIIFVWLLSPKNLVSSSLDRRAKGVLLCTYLQESQPMPLPWREILGRRGKTLPSAISIDLWICSTECFGANLKAIKLLSSALLMLPGRIGICAAYFWNTEDMQVLMQGRTTQIISYLYKVFNYAPNTLGLHAC